MLHPRVSDIQKKIELKNIYLIINVNYLPCANRMLTSMKQPTTTSTAFKTALILLKG